MEENRANPYQPNNLDGAKRENRRRLGASQRRVLVWLLGFVVLMGANATVEIVLLPLFGVASGESNDLYFQLWWVAVAFWLVFGNQLLGWLALRTENETAG